MEGQERPQAGRIARYWHRAGWNQERKRGDEHQSRNDRACATAEFHTTA